MKKITKYFMALVAVILGVFTITSCSKDDEEKFTGNAKELINKLIVNEDREEVAGDFTVPGHITYKDVTVDLTWKSENETALKFSKQDDGSYLADVTQQEKNTAVEFSASLTYNDETASKSFKVMVARFIPVEEALENFYFNANKGAAVELTGWIAYMSPESVSQGKTQRNFYILHESGLGGFYAYQTFVDADVSKNLKIGDPVVVKGEVDEYNGARQIGSSGSLALNEDLEANTNITKKDVTNDFIINDKRTMTLNTSIYATLSGIKVKEVKELDLSGEKPSSVQTLIVGERAGQTVNFVTTKYLTPYDTDDKTAQNISDKIKAEIQVGDYVTISGFSTWYNGTYQLQMISVDDISKDAGAPAISDAEKVSGALNTVTAEFVDSYETVTEIELPTTGSDNVALTYAVNEEATTAVIDGGKLIITPTDTLEEVVLTITAVLNDVTLTKEVEFSVQLKQDVEYTELTPLTAEQEKTQQETLVAAADKYAEEDAADGDKKPVGEEVTYQGVITHVSETKPMVLVQTSAGAVYVYPKKDFEDYATTFVVGHLVKVTGKVSVFNGLIEINHETATLGQPVEIPAYTDITNIIKDGVTNDELKPYQSMLVELKGVTYTADKTLTLESGSINWYFDGKIFTGQLNTELVAGNVYDIKGFVNVYNKYQISPISADAVTLVKENVPAPEPEPEPEFEADLVIAPTVSETTKPAEGDVSSIFTSYEGLTITYALNQAGSNAMAVYKDHIRLYGYNSYQGLEGVGNSLKFAFSGKKVASVMVEYLTDKKGQIKINDQELEAIEANHSYDIVNFAEAVSEFTITTISTTQAKIASISVIFAE